MPGSVYCLPVRERNIKVFIASPGDLPAERRAFRHAIEILNVGFGDGANVEFVALGWEDTLAATGRRPQGVINAEIDSCDVFVLALNRRWGQEAPDAQLYTSYTEEEFHRALERFRRTKCPEIFVFFKNIDPKSMADPQLGKVLAFRREIEKSRQVLYHTFSDDAAFKTEIDRHLRAYVKGELPKVGAASERVVLPLEYLTRVNEAEAQCHGALNAARIARDREGIAVAERAHLAFTVARRAANAALNGGLEEARQDFAQAVQGAAHPATLFLAYSFYYRTGDMEAAEQVVRRVLKFKAQDAHLRCVALSALAEICHHRGDLDTCERLYGEALEAALGIGDTIQVATIYSDLGLLYALRCELNRAEASHLRALAVYEKIPYEAGVAEQYTNLGSTYQKKGDFDKAEAMHRKALSLFEKLRDESGIACSYSNIAVVDSRRGDGVGSEQMHLKALAIFEKLGDRVHAAIQYSSLGVIHRERGELDKAETMQQRALAIDRDIGNAEGIARDLSNLGAVLNARGQLEKAEELFHRALALDTKLGNKRGAAGTYGNLAMVRLARGDLDGAEGFQQKAVCLFEEVGDAYGIGVNRGNLARIYQERGDVAKAVECADRSFEAFERAPSPKKACKALVTLAILLEKARDFDRLELALHRIQKFPCDADHTEAVGAMYGSLAREYCARGDDAKVVGVARDLLRFAHASPPVKTTDLIVWAHQAIIRQLTAQMGDAPDPDDQRLVELCEHCDELLKISPEISERAALLLWWAEALACRAGISLHNPDETLLQQACSKYEEAIVVTPDGWEVVCNYARAIAALARCRTGAAAESLRSKAIAALESVLLVKPDAADCSYELGFLFMDHTGGKSSAERNDLHRRACSAFDSYLQFDPNNDAVLRAFAHALAERASVAPGETARELYKEALAKLQTAHRLNSTDPDTLYNWGVILSEQADIVPAAEAEPLLVQAAQKYEEALVLAPNMHEALCNLAAIRSHQARGKSETAAHTLLEQAKTLLLRAEAVVPGSTGNELASIYALLGCEEASHSALRG